MTNFQQFKKTCKEFGENPRNLSIPMLIQYANAAQGQEQLNLNGLLASLRTSYVCPRCGQPLYLSDVSGYDFVCPECDENFYEVEVPVLAVVMT